MPTLSKEEEKKSKDPSSTSAAYDAMIPMWIKIDTLLAGTEAMRDAGTEYLPQHAGEEDKVYSERRDTATLLNMTELTLNSWVGRPFSDPVKVPEDMDPAILPLLEDVDLQGNNIDVFARNWFKDGVAKALSHVIIDSPRLRDTEAEEGRPRTKADDAAEGIRPYWVHVRPENVIFAHSEVVDGREVLMHLRIHETVVEKVGFTEVERQRIKVWEPGTVETFELTIVGKKEVWLSIDLFEYDLDFIPLVTFYSDRNDFMMGKPPLLDLADLNIRHWQGGSDQNSILTVARFPMLALSGEADDSATVKVGPRQFLHATGERSKFYYVEHDGKAIEAGHKDQETLKEEMCEYGAEFLKKRPGNLTATARALDSAEATSPLQDMVVRFQDALNEVIKITGLWLKIQVDKKVEVNREFGPEEVSDADLKQLGEARKGRDIARKPYLEELQRRGAISDEFDFDENEKELQLERDAFDGTSSTDIDPLAEE